MLSGERCQSGCVPEVEHRCAKPGATSTADAASASSATAGIARELSGIREDSLKLLRAETDRMYVRARNAACLIAVATIVCVCVALTAAAALVLLLIGTALGVATLFGNAAWVGFVLVGAATLLLFAATGVLLWQALRQKWYQQALAKYPPLADEVPPTDETELLRQEVLKRRGLIKSRIDHALKTAVDPLSAMVREHPITAGAIASSVGFIIARSASKIQAFAPDEPRSEGPADQSHGLSEVMTGVLSLLLKIQ